MTVTERWEETEDKQDSQLQDQNHLGGHLVDLVKVDHPGAAGGQLQHGDLVDDLGAAVLALPPLPHELGGVLVARALLHTLTDHGELAPARRRERGGGGVYETGRLINIQQRDGAACILFREKETKKI